MYDRLYAMSTSSSQRLSLSLSKPSLAARRREQSFAIRHPQSTLEIVLIGASPLVVLSASATMPVPEQDLFLGAFA